MSTFGEEIVGRTFKKADVVFMVMGINPYPEDRVSKQHRRILDLELGQLVAVPYRGIMIPNITVRGGVVRLTQIAVEGTVLSGPKAISAALGINQPYRSYAIHRVA